MIKATANVQRERVYQCIHESNKAISYKLIYTSYFGQQSYFSELFLTGERQTQWVMHDQPTGTSSLSKK